MKGHRVVLHIDGASRGNPGRAGAGILATDEDGGKLSELSRYLGRKTNNEAEYWALIIGLREAKRLGGDAVRVFTDSELLQRQVTGVYRVRNVKLKPLHGAAVRSLSEFSSFDIESVPREMNREADRLANEAIDRRLVREKEEGG